MHPTATTGLKNSTQKFSFKAVITGVAAEVPLPFVAVVFGAASFSSKPALSIPFSPSVVPLLTVPLVDCTLLWSTSFSTKIMYRHPNTLMGMQRSSNSEKK